MINQELFNPKGIVVVGGSNNTSKPGGKVLENLIQGGYKNLYVVNPNQIEVQGVKSVRSFEHLPEIDLAIMAIPAPDSMDAIKGLYEHGVKAFIILSAGFSEFDDRGKEIESEIRNYALQNDISVFGPNCIGIINGNFKGAFTLPIPKYNAKGIEFISSSGSTAVFVMEAGMKMGMQFSNIYSVGNAMMIDVEDILEYLDTNFNSDHSSRIIAIYIEQISNPAKLIKHSRSLIRKGCEIVGIKSGITEAGGRAASSHTGAMATPEVIVSAIFQKAGIIQCDSREEMLYVAGVLFYGKPKGKNLGIITHAGGAGVLCADAAEKSGLIIPEIKGEKADELLSKLHFGSSVKNPIDFLATGNKEQLSMIIDYCNEDFNNLDQLVVIFGSPGLFDVGPVYNVLSEKIDKSRKTIYPVLPSPVNTEEAMNEFVKKDKIFFPDEAVLARAIGKIVNKIPVFEVVEDSETIVDQDISEIISRNSNRYLNVGDVEKLLDSFQIPFIRQYEVRDEKEIEKIVKITNFPVVMKANGLLHKSDEGGVILNINDQEASIISFRKLIEIEGVYSCMIQSMIAGTEIYIGSKKDEIDENLIMFGPGGIFLEIMKDTQSAIAPITKEEARTLISRLKAYPILQGARGKEGIDIDKYAEMILKVSNMVNNIPEITEIDINPFIATKNAIFAVDCRIKIK